MTVRLLDFGAPNPFVGIFGRPRTLAWPVDAYRVTLPTSGRGDGASNPFEQVILGVLQAEPGLDHDALAEVTCIPVELVRSVTLRLRDKRLLDDDNRPPRQAETSKAMAREGAIVTAIIFREGLAGRFLPYIQVLDSGSPLRFKTLEEIRHRDRRILRSSGRAESHAPPSPRDVFAVVRQARQRSRAFGRDARLPDLAQIRIATSADRYLLECPIAIQRSDADFRIADPFGNGFSRVLEEVLAAELVRDESLQQWMTDWQTSLRSVDSDEKVRDRQPQPFEAERIRSRYPKLVMSLIPGRSLGHRSIAKIYASLEWALFYCADTRDPTIAIEVLRHTRAEAWSERLGAAAQRVGLDVPPTGFRVIPQGRLADMLDGKAEMNTVLAATLVQAERDGAHPLRRLAARHPDFLLRVQEIREIRDKREHGAAPSEANEGESRFDPMLRDWVTALIPGVQFDHSAATEARPDTADDRRLDARTSVIGRLGYAVMNRLPGSARDALVDAEAAWIAHQDGDDALPLVGRLYAALQSVTADRLNGLPSISISGEDYIRQAATRAEVAGFGRLPDDLAFVRPDRVREAMFGNGATLGACVVALLLALSDARLSSVAAAHPSLLADIGDVIAKRGHGNDPLPLDRAAARSLRTPAMNSIRTLMEA